MLKLIFLTTLVVAFAAGDYLMSDEYIDQINREATTWTAGRNFAANTSFLSIKRRLGAIIEERPEFDITSENDYEDEYPESFDARDKWGSMCPSVMAIRDQSECGSCWAFGAAEAMTDRTCIASRGAFKKTISADDLLSCCESCGNGCEGGFPSQAWKYWVEVGISTGGEYGDKKSCKPYPFPKCEHHGTKGKYPDCPADPYDTPECVQECQEGYPLPYARDLQKGKKSFRVPRSQYQKELMEHGPFEVSFSVYSDWMHYKSGVYQPTPSAKYVGGHAVKIIGWGVENGVKYWTIVNSWNEDWGFDGTFKILRGKNTCGIEANGDAGYAYVE